MTRRVFEGWTIDKLLAERSALRTALRHEGSETCECAACKWAFHDVVPTSDTENGGGREIE